MKKILTITFIITIIFSLAGCDTETVSVYNENKNDTSPSNQDEYFISPTDQYKVGETIIIGEIMQFDGKYIHIISGDLVQVFEYDNSKEEQFYINQTVSLIKGEKHNELQEYLIKDFTMKHTNMGMILTEIKGTVSEVSNEQLIVESEGKRVTIKTNKQIDVIEGTQVTAVCGDFGEGYSLVYLLNEDSKLFLEVMDINRNDDGHMILSLTDTEGGEYSVGMSGAILELNLSEIKVGDELVFYHEGIMESWPMQLATVLITTME